MVDSWLCQRVEEIDDRLQRTELILDRLGMGAGATANFHGTTFEISEYQIAQWVAGTTLPLGTSSSYVRFKDGSLEIRGGKFDIHTGESGAHMTFDSSALLGYNSSESNTIKLDWSTGSLWAKSGGFGGTVSAPVIVLDDTSADIFVSSPIYLGTDDTGLVVGGIDSGVRYISSNNFSTGVSGWQIRNDGDAEFNNVVLRGELHTDYVDITDSGIQITLGDAFDTAKSVKFTTTDDVLVSSVDGYYSSVTGVGRLVSKYSNKDNQLILKSESVDTYNSSVWLQAYSGTAYTQIKLESDTDTGVYSISAVSNLFSFYITSSGVIKFIDDATSTIEAQLYNTGDFCTNGGVYAGSDTGTVADGCVTATSHITTGADLCYAGNQRPYRNSTYYTGYVVVPVSPPASSASWDGDAKATDSDGIIDLSSVFGIPAGVKGVFVSLGALDETVGVSFALATTSGIGWALQAKTQVANLYTFTNGFVPCDSNGDIYWLTDGELDGVQIVINGYVI